MKTRRQGDPPVYIHGVEVEKVNSFRYLGITITENLSKSAQKILVRSSQVRIIGGLLQMRTDTLFQSQAFPFT